ncbi:MAG: hypothetical protein HY887_02560 [Deltaproteobacteria bacterium]|nr:hypothetical protein [Deltaproteobacteria bacterium]
MKVIEGAQLEILNDAFAGFQRASMRLEERYAALEHRLEALNNELAEKNRVLERGRRMAAMGEMAANIAHEIRNPLGSMRIFADLLERELDGEHEKKRLAGYITKGVNDLDNILSNMLLFASAPEPGLKEVDLHELMEDCLVLSGARAGKAMEVRAEFNGRARVMADGPQLRQVFLNLFLNAVDAVDGKGTVIVSVKDSAEEGFVDVIIRDNGKGIPGEHIDRIFDPFFSTKDRGTGLGLAIVNSIVSAHNGAIDVDSAPGEGTRFIIRLPAPGRGVCGRGVDG